MAHEITESDGLVLTGKRAWHGLGLVVQDAPTPTEALKLAKLDWTVEQWDITATHPTNESIYRSVRSHVANVRSDNHAVLGVVDDGYVPIQNSELADFATLLGGEDVVKVESAASIQGGKRVWFLLRANSFKVKGFNDEVTPYVLLANSHDGTQTFRARPTSIRTVCKNTLSLALGQTTDLEVRIRHEGNLTDKLGQVRRVLGLFDKQNRDFEEKVNYLAARKLSREELQRYFVEVYSEAFNPIPESSDSKPLQRQRKAANIAIQNFGAIYDRERSLSGDNAWTALNAVTGFIQHNATVRGLDDNARSENRLRSNLFGTNIVRTDVAAKLALQLI